VHEATAPIVVPTAAPEPGPSLVAEREARLPGMDRAATVPVHARARIAEGAAIAGPAILAQEDTTTLVPPGWTARALASGALLLLHGER
jgi:N-methylhydantoinase A/oxoprolinase/acetone carboxylase beta subunit